MRLRPSSHRFALNWNPLKDNRGDLAAWYHTGAGLVADSSGNVSQWSDQGSYGRHLLQAVGAAQPLVTLAGNQGNLFAYSEQFDLSPWALTGAIVNGAAAPPAGIAGAQNIDLFDGASGERLSQIYQNTTPMAGRLFRAYLWLKGAGANIGKTVRISLLGANGTANAVVVDYVLTGDWVRVDTGLWTSGANTTGVKLSLECLNPTSGSPHTFALTGAQLVEDDWADLYIPTTGFSQPAGLGNQRTVFFNGTTHYLKATAFTLIQPETIYLVVRQKSWVSNSEFFDGNATDSGELYQATSSPYVRLYAGASGPLNTTMTINTWRIVSAGINGASSLIQLNAGPPTAGNAGAANMGGLTLGAGATGTHKTNIQVGELLLYTAAHDANARSQIVHYLANKWGIGL